MDVPIAGSAMDVPIAGSAMDVPIAGWLRDVVLVDKEGTEVPLSKVAHSELIAVSG